MTEAPGKGALRRNTKKSSDKSPGMMGSITFSENIPAGSKLYIATWRNVNKEDPDDIWFSVRISWPQERESGNARPRNSLDDEIPF